MESVKQETNVAGRFADIFAREGVRGLWRGVGPTTSRAAVVAAAQLSTYDQVKMALIRHRILDDNAANYLVSSLASATSACLVSNPFDVVRTRLMSQRRLLQTGGVIAAGEADALAAAGGAVPSANRLIYRSSLHCLAVTVRSESPAALYKGFLPSLSRMLVWNFVFFQIYEALMKRRRRQLQLQRESLTK